MLKTEHELLLDVLEQPDDDGPRYVYADVLTERGDPRGEYVQLACQLEHLAARREPEQYLKRLAREHELLEKGGEQWAAQSIPFEARYAFRRGFVASLQCLPAQILQWGMMVLAPVQWLTLDGEVTFETLQQLLAMPLGRRLKDVEVSLVPEGREIPGVPRPAMLERLSLRTLYPQTLERLEVMGLLPGLKTLALPLMSALPAELQRLRERQPAELKTLELTWGAVNRLAPFRQPLQQTLEAMPQLRLRWYGVDYDAQSFSKLEEDWSAPPPTSAGRTPSLPPGGLAWPVAREGPTPAQPSAGVLTQFRKWWQPGEAESTEPVDERLFLAPQPEQKLQPGRYATVTRWRGQDQTRGCLMFRGETHRQGEARSAFERDAAELLTLPAHPRLLTWARAVQRGAALWLVSEPTSGITLSEGLAKVSPPPAVAARWLGQLLSAVHHLFTLRGAYDPIDSEDLWLTDSGEVKLIPRLHHTLRMEEAEFPATTPRDWLGGMTRPLTQTGPRLSGEMGLVLDPSHRMAPRGVARQLATVFFEWMTLTPVLHFGRSRDVYTLFAHYLFRRRLLELSALSLSAVREELAPFEAVFRRAVSPVRAEQFESLLEFQAALDAVPEVATAAESAAYVQKVKSGEPPVKPKQPE